ncbi:hypothetical protein [uncultured Adlercreutzia sp.]|uniref:hypothetical protein n=1 Tax=uncultured Adlercreutzia sp. TaxID=875803 RepID=UPI00266D2DFD|nr:hypothetical protein [uncultured Adlercreutzia sp.]
MAKQYITYEPIDWAQGVSGGTPLNASNLNRMEDAIEELVEKVNAPITSDDIGEDAVGNAQIAADSVTSDKLAQSVRDSLSRLSTSSDTVQIKLSNETQLRLILSDTALRANIMIDGSWKTAKTLLTW